MPEVIGYMAVHNRIRRERGSATNYMCPCGKSAAEWAYTHDDPCPNEMTSPRGQKYSTDINRYRPMCRHCHRVYDKSVIQECPAGHPYAGRNLIIDAGKRKCRTCVYARNRKHKPTPAQQRRRNELQRLRRKAASDVAPASQSAERAAVRTEPLFEVA